MKIIKDPVYAAIINMYDKVGDHIYLATRIGSLAQYICDLDDAESQIGAAKKFVPAIGEYWKGEGGIYGGIFRPVADVDPYHLVFAAKEHGDFASLEWGGCGEDEPGATSEWDGAANTLALVESGISHPAAEYCAELRIDGRTGFYLPAQREIMLGYANLPDQFERVWYWSSTQYSPYYAYVQYFADGGTSYIFKDDEVRALAVRRFTI